MTTRRGGDVDLARVGELVGDRTRARMLVLLASGREVSAGVLAAECGVSRATASGHLRRLVAGGLVVVRAEGRYRHFSLADERVADAVERLMELAPVEPVVSLRSQRRAQQLRRARTCYDHLAGALGVGLMASLVAQGHVVGGDGRFDERTTVADRPAAPGADVDYALSASGEAFLADLGVELATGRRPLVRYCIDWTESRHHLAGRLGMGLRDRFAKARWVAPAEGPRALVVTDAGADVLQSAFGLDPGTLELSAPPAAPSAGCRATDPRGDDRRLDARDRPATDRAIGESDEGRHPRRRRGVR